MPRPKLEPTSRQRDLVRSLAACGVAHEYIAREIGIKSPKTLRKYFRDELDLGAERANATVAKTAFQLAASGTCPAMTMFWLKSRAGWREQREFQPPGAPPPFIVAKDEEAA